MKSTCVPEGQRLTEVDLEALPPQSIFAEGVAENKEGHLFMTGGGGLLRWVAVTGTVGDWCIYCHWYGADRLWVKEHGDKVQMEDHIRFLVPCTEGALRRYRR